LCRNNPTLLESSKEQLEVWLLEQALSGSLWVRGVGDDNIEGILVIVQELEAISNMNLDLRVLETNRHAWEILL
jgi:hypothetical protein